MFGGFALIGWIRVKFQASICVDLALFGWQSDNEAVHNKLNASKMTMQNEIAQRDPKNRVDSF